MTYIHKVFIADDETLFRNAIELVINSEEDMEVVGKLAKYVLENKTPVHEYEISSFVKTDPNFSGREREVMHFLLNRLTNREIGDKLFVTKGTEKNHLTVIYEKLDVKSRHEAIQSLKKG